jgi:hypothetical protein
VVAIRADERLVAANWLVVSPFGLTRVDSS